MLRGGRVSYGHELTVRTDQGIGLEFTRAFPLYEVLYRLFPLPVTPSGSDATVSDG